MVHAVRRKRSSMIALLTRCCAVVALVTAAACDVLGPDRGKIDYVEVVAAESHACALAATGAAYCWGATQDDAVRPPRAVSGSQRFEDLSLTRVNGAWEQDYSPQEPTVVVQAGSWGVTRDGSAAYWGSESWQGAGVPTSIEADFEAIVAGGVFGIIPNGRLSGGPGPGYNLTTCGLTAEGEIRCSGDNQFGQLGRGPGAIASDEWEPVSGSVRYATLPDGSLDGLHVCALSVEQQAYCWGLNSSGQLGADSDERCLGLSLFPNAPESPCSRTPLPAAGGQRFVDIAVGRAYVCALDLAGAIQCWGRNSDGELGRGFVSPGEAPAAVSSDIRFTSVSAGGSHACATAEDGRGYCWGNNSSGQLGDGTTSGAPFPREIAGGHRFTSISAGAGAFTCGITVTGRVLCWGHGFHGQLGNASRESSLVPVPILDPV